MKNNSSNKNHLTNAKCCVVSFFLLIILLLLSPIILIGFVVSKIRNAKKNNTANKRAPRNTDIRTSKKFQYTDVIPNTPVSDEEFIQHLNEFVCIQKYTSIDRSGKVRLREYIVSHDPDRKEKIIEFFQENPIENFLQCDRDEKSFDVDRWEIRFYFNNSRYNRRIVGYGQTNETYKFLQIEYLLDEILTQEEIDKREWQKQIFLNQFNNNSHK